VHGNLAATTQRLNLITADLQEGVMKTRMQQIASVFSKMPRVVRDLALSCGKRVTVDMEGGDTEVDRTLLEAIKDPLTHLVRNAIDHGLETPEERAACGKPVEGTLRLRAYHAGGQVNIEISDDGHGILVERVREKALQRGIINAEQAGRMADRELVNLIFAPGFSTATKVTSVSGRGVGLDVVKTNVERVGGTVEIETWPGRGTLFRLKIPLTLAIIPAIIATCAGDRFAIPQISLLELVHVAPDQIARAVERMHGVPVYRLRDRLLPLVHLDQLLHGSLQRPASEGFDIAVVQAVDTQFGLIVDTTHDTADIVVKPLGSHLKGLGAYAGATILGDGHVALILDVLGLAKASGVLDENDRTRTSDKRMIVAGDRSEALLVCRAGDGQVAFRLASVARLEKIAARAVEHVGDEEVVQYRGDIMPLVRLSRVYPTAAAEETGAALDVVVHDHAGKSAGLIVGEILDIVHQEILIARRATRPGVEGSMVVRGRVTELLDVETLLDMAGVRRAPALAAAGEAAA
jgi:two-component system chemotaxis sensor kinase CheA